MKKTILSMLSAICLATAILTVSAFAAEQAVPTASPFPDIDGELYWASGDGATYDDTAKTFRVPAGLTVHIGSSEFTAVGTASVFRLTDTGISLENGSLSVSAATNVTVGDRTYRINFCNATYTKNDGNVTIGSVSDSTSLSVWGSASHFKVSFEPLGTSTITVTPSQLVFENVKNAPDFSLPGGFSVTGSNGNYTAVVSRIYYSLFIGGVQVTDDNLNGNGWSYDVSSNKLSLNNATINGLKNDTNPPAESQVPAVYYNGSSPLTVELLGNNTLTAGLEYSGVSSGIRTESGLEIMGNGSLSVRAVELGSNRSIAINVKGTLNISGCTVTAVAENGAGCTNGISCGSLSITDSSVTVNASDPLSSCADAISCESGRVYIGPDSSVSVTGERWGIYGDTIMIEGPVSSLSVTGEELAFQILDTLSVLPETTTVNVIENGSAYACSFKDFIAKADLYSVTSFAILRPSYNIAASADPAEGGTVTGDGIYSEGESVTVMALANSGYTFATWTENGQSIHTDAVYTFTASEDRTLTAVFEPVPTPSASPAPGSPSGGSSSGNRLSDAGTSPAPGVDLTPSPAASHPEDHDLNADRGSSTPLPDVPQTVETGKGWKLALLGLSGVLLLLFFFLRRQYTVTVSADPAEGGTVTGGGSYRKNDPVTVTAAAHGGYVFVKWTENGRTVSTDASYTFEISAKRVLVAVFEQV